MKAVQGLFTVISLLVSSLTWGKHVTGKGYMVHNKLNKMSKFSFRPGLSEVIGNITYEKEPRGKLYFFMDTNWEEFRGDESCDGMRVAHTVIDIGKVGERINVGIGMAVGYEPVKVPAEGRELYTWKFKWEVRHEVRTYGWYFVAAHCEFHSDGRRKGSAGSYHKRFLRDQIQYDLNIYNPGRDHLPADEHWLDKIYLLTVIFMCGAGYVFRKNSTGKPHLVLKLLYIAYVAQVASMVMEICHLTLYSYNGYGAFVLDFLSEVVEGVSQLVITYVLLFLANGWTVVQHEKKPSKFEDPSIGQTMNNPTLLDADSPVLLFIVLTVFATTILQILNKVFDRDFQKFHDYETYAGFCLLILRVIYAFFFMYAFHHTISRMKKQGHQGVGFMRRLQIAGSLWFWSFPLLYVIASFFAHYLRHFVVTAGVLLTQTSCLLTLSYQFVSTKSTLSRYSSVSASDILPGFSSSSSKYF